MSRAIRNIAIIAHVDHGKTTMVDKLLSQAGSFASHPLGKSLLEIVPGAQEAVKAMNYLFDSDYVTGQTLHLNGGRHLK